MTVSKESLVGAQSMIDGIIKEKCCGPILVRLAWHDSGTFDVNVTDPWPAAGGAIASIRFLPEISHGANAGLSNALAILQPVKVAFPDVSYADIFQMASARAIALAGGPIIEMKYVETSTPRYDHRHNTLLASQLSTGTH
jgi:L-ascorbate peroxidase